MELAETLAENQTQHPNPSPDFSADSGTVDFTEPGAEYAPPPPVAENDGLGEMISDEPDPDGSALLAAYALDAVCSYGLGEPLTEEEGQEFQEDLAAVLAKHGVPDLPIAEEAKLVMTTARIVVPRIMAAKAAADEETDAYDVPGNRKEGEREIHPFAKARSQAASAADAADSLLS